MRKLILILISNLCTMSVYAADFSNLTVSRTDPSYLFLTFLFGTVSDDLQCVGACTGLTPALFKMLNLGVLTAGGLMFAYVVLISTIQSANEGEFLGKKFDSVTTPIKSVMGLGFLLPTTTGYSLLQSLFMKLVLLSVAFANLMYGEVKRYHVAFDTSLSVEKISVDQNSLEEIDLFVKELTPYIVKAELCKAYYNEPIRQDELNLSGLIDTSYAFDAVKYVETADQVADFSMPNYCGVIKFDFSTNEETAQKLSQNVMPLVQSFISDTNSLAGDWMLTYSNPPQQGVSPSVNQENLENLVQLMIKLRNDFVSSLTSNVYENTEVDTTKLNWLEFPLSFYSWTGNDDDKALKMSQIYGAAPGIKSSDSIVPSEKVSQDPNFAEMIISFNAVWGQNKEKLHDEYQAAINQLNKSPTTLFGDFEYSVSSGKSALDALQGLYPILDRIVSMQEDPIHALADYGMFLFKLAYGMLLSAFALNMVIAAVSAYFASKSSTYAVGLTSSIGGFIAAFFTVFGFLIPIGSMLGIYLPMLPVLMFGLGVLSWFMQVCESMVAGPIVALGLMSPGQDFLGKASPALLMVINIMIRPMLMILGTVIGAKLFVLVAAYFTFFMATSFIKFNPSGMILTVVVFLYMYSAVMLALAQRCYSLMYMIPDKIMSWIGGHNMSSNQETAQDLGALQQGAKKGSEQVKEEMKGASKAVENLSKGISNTILEKNKNS